MQRLYPCKILTLGQKLKFQKTCQNPFYKSFTMVLCKKPLQKNTKYSRNETILKIGYHTKAKCPCKILTLGQKLKFHKTCQNPFYKSFTIVLCKKPFPKHTKYSTNETILKIGHHAKAKCPCKILTLGQKLKFHKTCQNPLYKSFTIVLRKKPLQKH